MPRDRTPTEADSPEAADLDRTDEVPVLRLENFDAEVAASEHGPASGGLPYRPGGSARGEVDRLVQLFMKQEQELEAARAARASAEQVSLDLERRLCDTLERVTALEARDGSDLAGTELAARVADVAHELAESRQREAELRRLLAAEHEAMTLPGLRRERDQADQATAAALERRLQETEVRATTYFERLSSREWRRSVWEELWRDLDAQLDASRAAAALAETRCAALDIEIAELKDALAVRASSIEQAGRVAEMSLHAQSSEPQELPARAAADDVLTADPARGRVRENAMAAAKLTRIDGGAPASFALVGRMTVGRALDNDLRLTDASVSRHHAIIVAGPSGVFIQDLGTVNGVGVQGRHVRRVQLADGDLVTIGLALFRFSAAPGSETSARIGNR